nr:hypothetical protein Q903MT_gene1320 [Picea sitchensis]
MTNCFPLAKSSWQVITYIICSVYSFSLHVLLSVSLLQFQLSNSKSHKILSLARKQNGPKEIPSG